MSGNDACLLLSCMGAAVGDRGCRRWGGCGRGGGGRDGGGPGDGGGGPDRSVVVEVAGSVVGEPLALLSLPCVRAHV